MSTQDVRRPTVRKPTPIRNAFPLTSFTRLNARLNDRLSGLRSGDPPLDSTPVPSTHVRPVPPFVSLLIATFAALVFATSPRVIHAQSDNPAPDWDPPYCGEQPRIYSVYDNDQPTYTENGNVILYSGLDVRPCGLRYDGHSGFDFTRASGRQECSGGNRPGVAHSLVVAAADGVVRRSRWYAANHESGYGLHIDITQSTSKFGDLAHLYGHLAAVFVEEGQRVSKGQAIGAVGTTGHSTGPHLHFQAAKGDRGDISNNTFDPYGWNAMYGPGYRYPGYEQPHRGNGWPMRVITPGEHGPGCPSDCGTVIVEDDAPSVTYGCGAGVGLGACPHWYRNGAGHGSGHHWTYPNGSTKDYWVRYTCPTCASGTYLVEAYVPFGSGIADTHIARYEAAGRVSILDQHEEGAIWHPIGVFSFGGTPVVELNDRTDRYDFTESAPRKIAADALRFRRICGGGGALVPGPGMDEGS